MEKSFLWTHLSISINIHLTGKSVCLCLNKNKHKVRATHTVMSFGFKVVMYMCGIKIITGFNDLRVDITKPYSMRAVQK